MVEPVRKQHTWRGGGEGEKGEARLALYIRLPFASCKGSQSPVTPGLATGLHFFKVQLPLVLSPWEPRC